MPYWIAAMLGGGIALMLNAPLLRLLPQVPDTRRRPQGRSVGALDLATGGGGRTDHAMAQLVAMARALDATPRR